MGAACQGECLPCGIGWKGTYPHGKRGARRVLTAEQLLERQLGSAVAGERAFGLQRLRELAPAVAGRHAAKALSMLQDPSWQVRHAAADALSWAPAADPADGAQEGGWPLAASPGVLEALRARASAGQEDAASRFVAGAVLRRAGLAPGEGAQDKGLLLEAVRIAGEALRYAEGAQRGDVEVVSAAVRGCGAALRHAAAELQKDEAIVSAAVAAPEGGQAAVQFAAPEVRERMFVLEEMDAYVPWEKHWKGVEDAMFRRSFLTEGACAGRASIAASVRSLACDLGARGCWGRAMALLDAYCGSRPSILYSKLRPEIPVAALILAMKSARRRFKYKDVDLLLAAHLDQVQLTPRLLRLLTGAEVHILSAMGGRVCALSAGDWSYVFMQRLLGSAVAPVHQEADEENKISAATTNVDTELKLMPERTLSEDTESVEEFPQFWSGSTAFSGGLLDCASRSSGSTTDEAPDAGEAFAWAPSGSGHRWEAALGPGPDQVALREAVIRKASALVDLLTAQVAASPAATPRTLALGACVLSLVGAGGLRLEELWAAAPTCGAALAEVLDGAAAAGLLPGEAPAEHCRVPTAALLRATGCGDEGCLCEAVAAAVRVAAAAAAVKLAAAAVKPGPA